MANQKISRNDQQKKILKASLLNPKNLFVLAVGLATGAISYVLIPVGVLAYGILCYLDFSSEDFVKKILHKGERVGTSPQAIPSFFRHQRTQLLKAEDLQQLQTNIVATREKMEHLAQEAPELTQNIFGESLQIDDLIKHSKAFLLKAQTIRSYLASEDVDRIQWDIATLEKKIRDVHDDFSKRQYQQALEARHKHLQTLHDIQQIYERLISQLTNISISLDSIYSRMMKLKTSDYSLTHLESEEVSAQLRQLLEDVEQMDIALSSNPVLPE